jgi:hypothetical protein
MPIKIKCPKCQKGLNVPDSLVGKRAACPGCKHVLTIPASAAAAAPGRPAASPAAPSGPAPVKGPPPARPTAKPAPRPAKAGDPPAKSSQPSEPASESPPEDVEKFAASLLNDESNGAPEKPPEYVEFVCPMCDEPVKMNVDMAGKQAPCPLCKRIVKVPMPASSKKEGWRAAPTRPAGARVDTEPAPEGAWSATDRKIVSREALEEADAIPVKRDPVSARQWIARGMVGTAVLALLGLGIFFVLGWLGGRKQKDLLEKAMNAVSGKKKTLAGPEAGIVHLAAGRYHLNRKERDCIRPEKGDAGAWNQFSAARGDLTAPDKMTAECDAVLIELALAQLDMGGSGKAVEEREKLSWQDTIKEVVRTVQAIRLPEAKLPPEGRSEAVRQLTRKLIEMGQPALVEDLARQIGDGPISLAVAGVEMYRAGKKETARKLFDQVMTYYKRDGAPAKGADGGKKAEPVLPALTMDVVALAYALGEEKTLPTVTEATQKNLRLMAEAVAPVLNGSAEDARQKVEKLPTAALRLEGLTAIADLATDESETRKTAEQAVGLIGSELRDQPVSPWVLVRLVRVGLKAGLSEASLLDSAVSRIHAESQLANWARLQVFRVQLGRETGKADEALLNSVEASTLSQRLARVDLARHNTRKDSGTIGAIEKWDESVRPFGYIGAALGLQGEK